MSPGRIYMLQYGISFRSFAMFMQTQIFCKLDFDLISYFYVIHLYKISSEQKYIFFDEYRAVYQRKIRIKKENSPELSFLKGNQKEY